MCIIIHSPVQRGMSPICRRKMNLTSADIFKSEMTGNETELGYLNLAECDARLPRCTQEISCFVRADYISFYRGILVLSGRFFGEENLISSRTNLADHFLYALLRGGSNQRRETAK